MGEFRCLSMGSCAGRVTLHIDGAKDSVLTPPTRMGRPTRVVSGRPCSAKRIFARQHQQFMAFRGNGGRL